MRRRNALFFRIVFFFTSHPRRFHQRCVRRTIITRTSSGACQETMMKRAIRMPAWPLPISRAPLACAHKDQDTVAIKIALGFAQLAGSRDNALALVHALHDGVEVRLITSITLASAAKARITEIA